MDTGLAIFVGAILATTGWLYGGRLQRLTARGHHTYQIVTRQQDDQRFIKSLETARLLIKDGSLLNLKDNSLKEQRNDLDYLLNHYEFLSAAIWRGDIDEKLMKSCEKSRLTSLFNQTKIYIDESRKTAKQPSMWENLERLAGRWGAWSPSPAERIYEVVMMRPCYECPRWLRRINGPIARVTDWGARVKSWWWPNNTN